MLWPLLKQLSKALLCGTHRALKQACLLHIGGLDVDVTCRQPEVVTRCAGVLLLVVALKIMNSRCSHQPPAAVFADVVELDSDGTQSLHS